jgi:hypothetical protein
MSDSWVRYSLLGVHYKTTSQLTSLGGRLDGMMLAYDSSSHVNIIDR